MVNSLIYIGVCTKLIAILKGKASEEVWEELERRPKKFVKNIIKEE
jgi:hypothetical protein